MKKQHLLILIAGLFSVYAGAQSPSKATSTIGGTAFSFSKTEQLVACKVKDNRWIVVKDLRPSGSSFHNYMAIEFNIKDVKFDHKILKNITPVKFTPIKVGKWPTNGEPGDTYDLRFQSESLKIFLSTDRVEVQKGMLRGSPMIERHPKAVLQLMNETGELEFTEETYCEINTYVFDL